MYWLRIGYWNGTYGQWGNIYIADDFKSFMMEDYDRESGKMVYVKNQLPAHLKYSKKVQAMLEQFAEQFTDINCAEDVYKIRGVLDFEKYEVDLPY